MKGRWRGREENGGGSSTKIQERGAGQRGGVEGRGRGEAEERGGEGGRERNIGLVTSHACLHWELNLQTFTLQDDAPTN